MNVTKISQSSLSSVDFNNLQFGKVFTDYMLVADFDDGRWGDYSIEPIKPLPMHPAISVLHYGQAIFEGLKAYKANNDVDVNIFRLSDNITRLNESAKRMCMPSMNEAKLKEAILTYIELQKNWVPSQDQGSLYVRPFMISTDTTLRAKPSASYKFICIASPVGFYYNKPLNIFVEKQHRRAASGGVGYAKAAGNYAASFYPTLNSNNEGFDQILWTDITNNYILEELGSANFFFVKDDTLYTPKLKDSILKGITRDTVIALAKANQIGVQEINLEADKFAQFLQTGKVQCMFATGTAAAITFINDITIDQHSCHVNSDQYKPVLGIKQTLSNIKYLEDTRFTEWNFVV